MRQHCPLESWDSAKYTCKAPFSDTKTIMSSIRKLEKPKAYLVRMQPMNSGLPFSCALPPFTTIGSRKHGDGPAQHDSC